MKILLYLLIALLPLFCTSCVLWWDRLTPGEVVGPIVPDPTEPEDKLMSGKTAATHMTTSLVMKCPAISAAGGQKPRIINDFVISAGKVNHLQMQVWRSLINMNMIIPVSDMKANPAFKLSSQIKGVPDRENGKVKYTWQMYMEKIADKKEVWRKEIEFGE